MEGKALFRQDVTVLRQSIVPSARLLLRQMPAAENLLRLKSADIIAPVLVVMKVCWFVNCTSMASELTVQASNALRWE